jgi:hypothetical protein
LNKPNAGELIKITTLKAKRLGIDVRWADSFIFNSITLANHDQIMGWIHIESAIDSASVLKDVRTGYLLFKDRAPDQFNMVLELFLKMWHKAKEPTL